MAKEGNQTGISDIKKQLDPLQPQDLLQPAENLDFSHIKLESLILLKESTKKLLCLIDEIQAKSCPDRPIPSAFAEKDLVAPLLHTLTCEVEDLPETSSLKKLETHIMELDKTNIENTHECSVYERLTRKCNCLNRKEFNDLVIHFNDDAKYFTSSLGEVMKNIRIVKKFLYMGGGYGKNALIFLNEGLAKCPHCEKVDIVLACSHADICNVFDDDSFVTKFFRSPSRRVTENVEDEATQTLAARVLYRLVVVEEGRRYLIFNSKTLNEIKMVLKKDLRHLKADCIEFLTTTLNLLSPKALPILNSSYHCKADEGMARQIINSLKYFRGHMTMEEILTNLDLLNQVCNNYKGIRDVKQYFINTCIVFKEMLLQYDKSEINIFVTSIMNKLIEEPKKYKNNDQTVYVVGDAATEPIPMKDQLNQAPSLIKNIKKTVKSRLGIPHMRYKRR